MKFTSLIALVGASAVFAQETTEEIPALSVEEQVRHDLGGFKSMYDGYYKSFYHTKSTDHTLKKCMDKKTIDNMIVLGSIVKDPLSLFEAKNLKNDLNLFGEGAEVISDLASCHFEQPFFDIWAMCHEGEGEEAGAACALPKLTENLTKNMFVMVGKLTQMGEAFTEMKDADDAEYAELWRGVGTDAGTMLRDMFAFTGKAPTDE